MTQVERVKQICKKKKISIHKLEMDCGFANGYISQLKKGVFPADRAEIIANYLGVGLDYIMGKTEQDEKPLRPIMMIDMAGSMSKPSIGIDFGNTYSAQPKTPEERSQAIKELYAENADLFKQASEVSELIDAFLEKKKKLEGSSYAEELQPKMVELLQAFQHATPADQDRALRILRGEADQS